MALQYNVLVGVEQFGKGLNLYLIPAMAFIITAINLVLYKFLNVNKKIFTALIAFASLVVQLTLLLVSILLSQVN